LDVVSGTLLMQTSIFIEKLLVGKYTKKTLNTMHA